jgi:hypothetical protein
MRETFGDINTTFLLSNNSINSIHNAAIRTSTSSALHSTMYLTNLIKTRKPKKCDADSSRAMLFYHAHPKT